MNILNTLLIFAVAFLAVFGQAAVPGLRDVLGAQVDLLPVLMVYAALNASLPLVAALAIFGGLCFDALSANPLGVTILPLFSVGLVIFLQRDLILRELSFAQIFLGTVASAAVPALSWGSLWQWLVMTAGGAVATPVIFALFNWLNRAFGYRPRTESSFRPDREILRGRN